MPQKVAVGIVVGLRTALTIVQLGVTWKQGKNPTLTRVQAAFDVLVTPFLLAVAIVAQVVLLSKVRLRMHRWPHPSPRHTRMPLAGTRAWN